MDRRRNRPATRIVATAVAVATAVGIGLAGAGSPGSGAPAEAAAAGTASVPATDCTAPVVYPLNSTLPGYVVPDDTLGRVCVPFTQVGLPPEGYRGDFLVQQNSDARGRRLLAQCRAQATCQAVEDARAYVPPQFRVTGSIVAEGRIDPLAGDVDLRDIRRPGFFGRAPYREAIASAEGRTSTIELTVPADPYERLNLGLTRPDKVRGWYIKGRGVPDASGHRVRSLALLIAGRSIETTAVQDPRDPLYTRDATTGASTSVVYPSRGTEKWGVRLWRQQLLELNRAGFDVLTFDKRGHGISGSVTADDTLQQGLDMLRALDALRSGTGVRTLGPDGVERSGRRAARALVADPSLVTRMPIVLGGASQGSFATDWAMNANFNRWCELDSPGRRCHAPWGYRNVVGATLLASFPVYAFPSDDVLLAEAARRAVNHVAFIPTSEPLRNIGSWPGAFFAKGLWDEVQGPYPTFDAYSRIRGPRELFLYRGPHSENEGGPANVALEQDRLVRFAAGLAVGRAPRGPAYPTLRAAVAASPPIWEYSTQPVAETTP